MPRRQSLLLIITDHQRADSIGMVQCDREVTPNLNRLAAGGVNFTRAYATAPLCIPSRTAMATGQYPTRGIAINDFTGEAAVAQQLATTHLAADGYHVAYIGKNDLRLRPPAADQVDLWVDHDDFGEYCAARQLTGNPGWDDDASRAHYYKEVNEHHTNAIVRRRYSHPATGVWQGALADFRDYFYYRRLRQYLASRAGALSPFAAVFSICSPHPPLMVPQPFAEWYDPARLKLPANVGIPARGEPANRARAVARQLAEDADEADHRRAWAAHLGLLGIVDDIVGRVLRDLDELGLAETTTVVFTSDHGHHLGQHNMFGINELYEQTVNVPLIVRHPGGAAGVVPQLVGHLDLMPTWLELAGVTPPAGLDGLSLAAALTSGASLPERPQFFQFSGQIAVGDLRRGMVTDRYKYIYDPRDQPELYDLHADPLETVNLANQPGYQPAVRDLHRQCRDWHLAHGDWIDY